MPGIKELLKNTLRERKEKAKANKIERDHLKKREEQAEHAAFRKARIERAKIRGRQRGLGTGKGKLERGIKTLESMSQYSSQAAEFIMPGLSDKPRKTSKRSKKRKKVVTTYY
jgi:hypothetical protein